jgi:hypothetical protein
MDIVIGYHFARFIRVDQIGMLQLAVTIANDEEPVPSPRVQLELRSGRRDQTIIDRFAGCRRRRKQKPDGREGEKKCAEASFPRE